MSKKLRGTTKDANRRRERHARSRRHLVGENTGRHGQRRRVAIFKRLWAAAFPPVYPDAVKKAILQRLQTELMAEGMWREGAPWWLLRCMPRAKEGETRHDSDQSWPHGPRSRATE